MKTNLAPIFLAFFAGLLNMTSSAQCEADHTIYLTDFAFSPSAITISVGETVAFINAEGVHNVDGTDASNPSAFFLEETEGNIDGVCMGIVTFDIPGTYAFTSSVGVQPELGMTGIITVDAVTLADRLFDFWGGGELESLQGWQSSYVLTSYFSSTFVGGVENPSWLGDLDLDGLEDYTVFVPTDAAVNDLMELMNLSQFDMAAFYDMPTALRYHIVPGTYMSADLADGMTLPTALGQPLTISLGDNGTQVDGSTIVVADIAAFNGVIHLVDQILAPAGYPSATTWDAIVQSPDHTILEQALLNEGLNEALRGQPILNDNEPAEGPFTVFAPTDAAFEAFAAENGFASVDDLMSSQFMDDILHAHLVEAVYESTQLSNGLNLNSYGGQNVNIAEDAGAFSANGASIVQPDILAYNGVVHSLGEVMPFDFPDPVGTCGTWTIHMTSNPAGGTGWGGATVNILSDGELIASETKTTDAPESFMIPVDAGSRVDVIYIAGGTPGYHGFEVVDENGNVVYSAQGTMNWNGVSTPPKSIYGLNPCEPASSCDWVEVQFLDDSQDGWFGGGMEVHTASGLAAEIFFNPDFDGDGYADYQGFNDRRVLVAVDPGEVDFYVNQPIVFAEYCGYIVRNAAGDILVDQNIDFESPDSVTGVIVCEAEQDISCNAAFEVQQSTTPGGTPIAGSVDVVIFDYNPDATYSWDFGDEGTSDEPFPTYTYGGNGPYTLCLTVSDPAAGCSDTFCASISVDDLGLLDGFAQGFIINVVNGGASNGANAVVERPDALPDIRLYPNPASDRVTLQGMSTGQSWTADWLHANGQTCHTARGTGPAELTLPSLPAGLYWVRITTDAATTTRRLVIQ